MESYLLDTDVSIELINAPGDFPDTLLGKEIAISSVTAYELAVGMEKCLSERTASETASFLSAIEIIDFSVEAGFESARVRAELERAGMGIGPYDTLIAGHCRQLDRTLLSNNQREFGRVRNLKVARVADL